MRALVVQLALLITTQTRVTLALSALLSSPYKHFNLERLCGPVKNKQSLYLHNQAHQFTFNSTNKELIKCHLELHLHSDIFGFSVFIQEMKLEDSDDCSRDFLQFGRDFIVFTSHKSKKRCGVLAPLDLSGQELGEDWVSQLARREYIETTDTEMDLWLSVYPPGPGGPNKELSLVVTPFKKQCSAGDGYYKQCPGSEKCIKRELFCDGFVNCDGDPKDEQEEYCLVNSSISNDNAILSIPIIILIVIFVLLGIMFMIFMLRFLCIAMKNARRASLNTSGPGVEAERRALASGPGELRLSGLGRTEANPSAPASPSEVSPRLPLQPPSYSEVVGSGEYKDDPPKYSEVPEESHTVIYKNY